MRIGIVIVRIGGVDGVALETEKWITVLRRLGHEVEILSGAREGDIDDVSVLPELALDHPLTSAGQERAFFGAPAREGDLLADLEREAGAIERAILDWAEEKGVECLVSENASALPCHLTLGMALRRVFERTGLPAVTHDHDFAWERGERYATPFRGVREIIAGCFPVSLPNVKHAVINRAARTALEDRFGIVGSEVVPNVMDFEEPFGVLDEFNGDLRAGLGMAEHDLLLFQITRIVRRKGIEIAIDLLRRLGDARFKLVVTGTAHDDDQGTYIGELREQVRRLGLIDRVLFAGSRFDNRRGRSPDGAKIYSLSDGYAHAAACTYFSLYEGFGNAFVEAVVAHRPVFVNNYEPVYWPDIGSLGFKTVMIEGGQLTDQAVEQAHAVLRDADLRREMAEHNFELGRQHFSYQTLERILARVFSFGSGAGAASGTSKE